MQQELAKQVSSTEKSLTDFSIKAEKSNYEKFYLKRIHLCKEMQKFFFKSLDENNMKAIQEIVKVHCLMEHNIRGNFIPIFGTMTCEDAEYLSAAKDGDQSKLQECFSEDCTTLQEEYRNVRKHSIPVKPDYDTCNAKFMDKLF